LIHDIEKSNIDDLEQMKMFRRLMKSKLPLPTPEEEGYPCICCGGEATIIYDYNHFEIKFFYSETRFTEKRSCGTYARVSCKNLHELINTLALCGDVESNPGPIMKDPTLWDYFPVNKNVKP